MLEYLADTENKLFSFTKIFKFLLLRLPQDSIRAGFYFVRLCLTIRFKQQILINLRFHISLQILVSVCLLLGLDYDKDRNTTHISY